MKATSDLNMSRHPSPPLFNDYQDKYLIMAHDILFPQQYASLNSLQQNTTDISCIDHQTTINHGKICSPAS